MKKYDESELLASFVTITTLSLFLLCLFFLEGEKKMERENNVDKKMNRDPFHQKIYLNVCF